MLGWFRRFDDYRRQQQQAHWQPMTLTPRDDFTVGVLGQSVVAALKPWGFPLRVWSRTPKQIDGVASFARRDALDDFLRGIEANIKNQQGEIDCSGPMLGSLDLIIAGFHEPVYAPGDKSHHTDAMIATMANGLAHIISHPGNPKFPVDIRAVAKQQPTTTWRWRSITPLLPPRVPAASRTAARWPKRSVTRVASWRSAPIPIQSLPSAISRTACASRAKWIFPTIAC
ncbi:putative phosphatase YcdX|nr:putative phosphatase YcdX [Candidatus Pantoea persica]